jgi:hypothetical protein
MLQSVVVDIINQKALKLLQDLELLHLICVRKEKKQDTGLTNWAKYKGAMTKQAKADINDQLNSLRKEWE